MPWWLLWLPVIARALRHALTRQQRLPHEWVDLSHRR